MKRALLFLLLGFFSACLPPPLEMVPIETVVAETIAAMPKTNTPPPSATTAPSRTPVVADTATPGLDLSAPGAACIPASTERQLGQVTRVLDGESFEVAIGNSALLVRYIGLDAPGISPLLEWQGPYAIAANERLIGGQKVTLVSDVTNFDANGFALRYVLANALFVNYELIRQGWARMASSPPDTACDAAFLSAQAQAEAARLGVWMPTPIPTATVTNTTPARPTITVTSTLVAACDCRDPRLRNCNAYRSQAQAQACYDYCIAAGFGPILDDKNGNGLVCEGLP